MAALTGENGHHSLFIAAESGGSAAVELEVDQGVPALVDAVELGRDWLVGINASLQRGEPMRLAPGIKDPQGKEGLLPKHLPPHTTLQGKQKG